MKRNLALAAATALLLAPAAWAQDGEGMANQAEKGNPRMSMGEMMEQCSEHCRSTAESIEETSALIEEARKGNDPQEMRMALGRAREQLEGMGEHMSGCTKMMEMMQKMHSGMMMGGGQDT